MFGISFYEFLVIGLIALLVFKPSNIPELLSGIGRVSRTIKDFFYGLQHEIEKTTALSGFDDYLVINKDKEDEIDSKIK